MKLHEQALTLLRVTGGDASLRPCKIEIDGYVPLQCRTHDEPLGGGYVRLGNYSSTLLELAVAPRTQVVHGVSITSIHEIGPWPAFVVSETLERLPVLSTDFQGHDVVDLRTDFNVAVRSGEVIAFWDKLVPCTGYRSGGACFLIADGVLAGIWFTGLTDEEMTRFVAHAGHT